MSLPRDLTAAEARAVLCAERDRLMREVEALRNKVIGLEMAIRIVSEETENVGAE